MDVRARGGELGELGWCIGVTKRQLAGSKVRGDEVCNGKTGGLCPNVGYKGAVGT